MPTPLIRVEGISDDMVGLHSFILNSKLQKALQTKSVSRLLGTFHLVAKSDLLGKWPSEAAPLLGH